MDISIVRAAYDRATGEWSGADWTHEYRGDESDEEYCEGHLGGCAVCRGGGGAAPPVRTALHVQPAPSGSLLGVGAGSLPPPGPFNP